MLSKPMVKALNAQLKREFYASNLYLQMSAWCLAKGLAGSAAFLRKQSAEEMDHMQRLFRYINETGAMAEVGEIDEPPTDYGSLDKLFQQTYDHECQVTRHINALMASALKENDYATVNFLQWYVAEQHEEENLFKSILDKIKIIGTSGPGLFLIDREIGEVAKATSS